MRIFYATDVHGSEVCWRKFLNAGPFHKADVLILGGDLAFGVVAPGSESQRRGRHVFERNDVPTQVAEDFERREAQGAASIPLRRFGRMRDVGLLAVYLASEASAYITGQTIAIDGGRTL